MPVAKSPEFLHRAVELARSGEGLTSAECKELVMDNAIWVGFRPISPGTKAHTGGFGWNTMARRD